jgi:hypothetical protein
MKYIIMFLLALGGQLFAQESEKELVDQTVDKGIIKANIHFLAMDALEGRDTGSPGLEIAADFAVSQFERHGVQSAPGMNSYRQRVPFTLVTPADVIEMTLGDKTLSAPDDFFIMEADNATIKNSSLVFLNHGLNNDFKDKDLTNKIVVANAGDTETDDPQSWYRASLQKREMAKAAGAVGVIELYYNPKSPYNFVKRFLASRKRMELGELPEGDGIFHLMVDASNEDIVNILKSGNTELQLTIDGINKSGIESENIIGFVEGTDPELKDEIIVFSAHYDHVGIGTADAIGDTIYNGARDNAVGTTTVLMAAENIAKYPLRRSSMFVLFTAEEKGLLGSEWFVENCPVDLKKIKYCFNSDNGGYDDTSVATIVGKERTTAQPLFEEACAAYGLETIDDQIGGFFDRSDNVNFAAKGIPAPTFSMGFRSFGEEIRKYYHQAADHADNLDYDYLDKFFRAYVLSARLIGNSETTFFWNQGDKYYDKGIELYNRN